MLFYPIKAETHREIKSIIDKIGADPSSLAWFEPKMHTHKLFARGIDYRAAAFMKQEMLARGGDVVVHRNVIDGGVKESDIIIVGASGVIRALLLKMHALDRWGLKELREELERALELIYIKSWEYPLSQKRILRLGEKSLIMGILNVTPDSFYPVSRIGNETDLISKAAKMLNEGADILDLGAESTRPGATPVSAEDERRRIIPAIKALRRVFPVAVISVDTLKPEIALEAAEAGADIINDVGKSPAMGDVALETGLPLVVTHSEPINKENSERLDIVDIVMSNLSDRLDALRKKGVKNLIVDPGIGFEKFGSDNMKLIKSISSLRSFGLPILVGHSRKKFLDIEDNGNKIAPTPEDRLSGTVAVSALLASSLANVEIIRVHDVLENVRAVRTAEAIST